VTWLSNGGSGPGFYVVRNNFFPKPATDGGANGFDCLPQSQVAKNTLIVGAVNDVTIDPYGNADVSAASFSSSGPTDDGRVKPDVVANGVALTSSVASGDTAYASFSGTSTSCRTCWDP
jgi:hypothetical protein